MSLQATKLLILVVNIVVAQLNTDFRNNNQNTFIGDKHQTRRDPKNWNSEDITFSPSDQGVIANQNFNRNQQSNNEYNSFSQSIADQNRLENLQNSGQKYVDESTYSNSNNGFNTITNTDQQYKTTTAIHQSQSRENEYSTSNSELRRSGHSLSNGESNRNNDLHSNRYDALSYSATTTKSPSRREKTRTSTFSALQPTTNRYDRTTFDRNDSRNQNQQPRNLYDKRRTDDDVRVVNDFGETYRTTKSSRNNLHDRRITEDDVRTDVANDFSETYRTTRPTRYNLHDRRTDDYVRTDVAKDFGETYRTTKASRHNQRESTLHSQDQKFSKFYDHTTQTSKEPFKQPKTRVQTGSPITQIPSQYDSATLDYNNYDRIGYQDQKTTNPTRRGIFDSPTTKRSKFEITRQLSQDRRDNSTATTTTRSKTKNTNRRSQSSSSQTEPTNYNRNTISSSSRFREGTTQRSKIGYTTNQAKSTTKIAQKRISERKYEEYMIRIFGDNDSDDENSLNSKSLDGREIVDPGEYPHMAAIGFRTTNNSMDWKCGGSLISEYYVLTAAHCCDFGGQKPSQINIGVINLKNDHGNSTPSQRIRIKEIHKHPLYRDDSYYHDIALLKLTEPAKFTVFVRPIRLWDKPLIPYDTVYAMGYGSTAFGKAKTNILTDLNLTIVENPECNQKLPKISELNVGVIESQMCAIDKRGNRDTCQGDSGGPLQLNLMGARRLKYHLVGITSFGVLCGGEHPSVYTRLSSFIDWIEGVVWSDI